MKKDFVCFDMDNTILNSKKTHIIAFQKAFRRNGLKKPNEKRLRSLFGITRHEIIKTLYPKLSGEKVRGVFDDIHEIMTKDTKRYVKPFNGTLKTLKKLKKKYKLGLISNSSHDEILVMLRAAKLNKKLFDVLIGNDDVGHPKPAPDEIFKAEKLMHMEVSYIIGDTTYDILAGKRACVKTIAVLTGTQPKGLLKRYKPDYIVKNITKVEKILL